jgi:hypothetical protein
MIISPYKVYVFVVDTYKGRDGVMYRLDPEPRAQQFRFCRMTGIARDTISSLLVDLGTACAEITDKALQNLRRRRISVRWNPGVLLRERQDRADRQARTGFELRNNRRGARHGDGSYCRGR